MWASAGEPGRTASLLLWITTAGYFLLQPVPCLLWSLYADCQLNRGIRRHRYVCLLAGLPVAVNSLLVIVSLRTGYLFRIDADNVYTRGPGFPVTAVICYAYLLMTFAQVLILRRRARREEFLPLLLFALPPTLGGMIQILWFGFALIWTGMTVSLLMIYIGVLNRRLRTDHLTGLHNRRELDEYLARRIRERSRGGMLAGIMIDVDSFKRINDTYGHAIGDEALERTGDILRASLRSDDFICRYGGDEFAIVLEVRRREDLVAAVQRILAAADQYNRTRETPYEIHLSCGYDVLVPGDGTTASGFLEHIDRLMYGEKNRKRVSGLG